MKESNYQQELKKRLQADGYWCYKIPDTIQASEMRFIPKKPADLIVVIDGKCILIECKMIKKLKKLDKTFFANTKEKKNKELDFRDYHQIDSLIKFARITNGNAYYAINYRVPRKENREYYIPIRDVIEILDEKGFVDVEKLEEYEALQFPEEIEFVYDLD